MSSFRILCILNIVLNILSYRSFAFTIHHRRISHYPSIRINNGIARTPPNPKKSTLYHRIHDHSHSHDHEISHDQDTKKPFPVRKTSIIFFTALCSIIPTIFRKRRLSRADIAFFGLISLALNALDSSRSNIKHFLFKLQRWREGFVKHSAPLIQQQEGSWPKILNKKLIGEQRDADRITVLGGVVNLVLSLIKFVVGVTCHSSALIADAGHSLSDLFSDFITLWAVRIGRLPPDDDHPYGHGKFEAIGSLFLALTLIGTGVSVGTVANKKLFEILSLQRTGAAVSVQIPTTPALLAAALSILSKEWLYRITKRVGENLNSQVIIANAWHHRSDAYSSILALVSIFLAIFVPGFLAADSAAGLCVAGMICMTGAEILGESVEQLTDANNAELVSRVEYQAEELEDVTTVKRVRARNVGSNSLVDLTVSVKDGLSPSAQRNVEQMLRYKILDENPGVIDADVRAEPPSAVVCPLLAVTAVNATIAEDGEKNGVSPPMAAAVAVPRWNTSTVHIEDEVREVLLNHPRVQAVPGVTVHYQDTLFVNVDAKIRVFNETDVTIQQANTLGTKLRKLVEDKCGVHHANIFLDLNEEEVGKLPSPSATSAMMP